MAKIDLEEVEATMLQNSVEPEKVNKVLKDLEIVIEELKADRKNGPRPKWEHIVMVNDPNGMLNRDNAENDLTAYVVQMEEGEDANMIASKMRDSAKEQNEQAKSKNQRLVTLRDIFSALKPKFLKQKKVKIRTKEPVRILVVNDQE